MTDTPRFPDTYGEYFCSDPTRSCPFEINNFPPEIRTGARFFLGTFGGAGQPDILYWRVGDRAGLVSARELSPLTDPSFSESDMLNVDPINDDEC